MTVTQGAPAAEVAARIRADAAAQQLRLQGVTEEFGLRLVTQVRANMSGRPGPRVQTGDLRRSVRLVLGGSADHVFRALAVTTSPQARRLEDGFIGVDSLGRHYHQPPYPAWRPAVDTVLPEYRAAVIRALPAPGGPR